MVAVVVVIVDVDDEEGEGGGEDAQRRKSNNPNLKGFLSCVNLYHIHIVRMQCCARGMFFHHSYGPSIASTLQSRKLMLRVDDRNRFYADALPYCTTWPLRKLMLRVENRLVRQASNFGS